MNEHVSFYILWHYTKWLGAPWHTKTGMESSLGWCKLAQIICHNLRAVTFSPIFIVVHGRRKVHDFFLLPLCKSSIWFTEKHIFKIIIYFFNTYIKMCRKLCHFIWGIWWFHRSKDFEAMNAGKSWLSCQYNENTLVDLLSSVLLLKNLSSTYLWLW